MAKAKAAGAKPATARKPRGTTVPATVPGVTRWGSMPNAGGAPNLGAQACVWLGSNGTTPTLVLLRQASGTTLHHYSAAAAPQAVTNRQGTRYMVPGIGAQVATGTVGGLHKAYLLAGNKWAGITGAYAP